MTEQRTRLAINLSPDAEEQLARIAAEAYAGSRQEAMRNLLLLVSIMQEAAAKDTPVVLELGSLELTNMAFRESNRTSSAEAIHGSQPSQRPATVEKMAFWKRSYSSLELKPGVFGIRVDLKKLLKLPDKL